MGELEVVEDRVDQVVLAILGDQEVLVDQVGHLVLVGLQFHRDLVVLVVRVEVVVVQADNIQMGMVQHMR
jgi:hypothetical protein